MKPLVLLDCDGVLANIVDTVLDCVHEHTERRYRHDHIVSYDILANLPESNDVKKKAWEAVKSPGTCFRMRPYVDAFAGVEALRQIAYVHIATTPLEGSLTWMPERVEWLKTHFDFQLKDITFTHRKDLLEGDFIIDDKPDNVLRFGGLLWDQPYNRKSRHPRRVRDWNEALQWVRRWGQ